jgi:hypothetical protein
LTDDLYNEDELRDFLFGDLSESERTALEDRFLADEDFSVQVQVVEAELIESYLRSELSARDQQRFEAAFLTQPRRRERVLVMKAVLATANASARLEAPLRPKHSPTFWAGVMASLRFQSAFARYAFAFAVLFVLALGALLLFNKLATKPDERLAQQPPRSIQPEATPSLSPNSSPNNSPPQQTASPVPRVSPSPTPEAPPARLTLATIVLRPTLARDPSAANKLNVSASVIQVQLLLRLDRNEYRSYGVRLTTVDGHLIWQARSVHARTMGAGTSIAVAIPARLLPTNDYLVEVSGVNESGPPESLASYFFSVTQK